MKRLLDKFFFPNSIAVFGATDKPEKVGFAVFRNLAGFSGKVYAINPKYDTVQGHTCYAEIGELPELPELVVFATPADTIAGLIKECGKAGIEAAIILSSGFKESGEEGVRRYEQLRRTATQYGVRIIGPNCLGILTPAIHLNASFATPMPGPGRLAFISQSGALGASVLDWAASKQVGFSHFVSIGNTADIGFHHLIDYFGADSRTACILIYMENLSEARKFMSAARAFARSKPIIILKAGATPAGAHAALLHSGTHPGDDVVHDAAFRRAGVIRVHTIQELFDCAQATAFEPLPRGNRLAIVTNGGGPAVLAADLLEQRGGTLSILSPQTLEILHQTLSKHWKQSNPVDVMGDATAEQYRTAVRACLLDHNVDALLAILTVQSITDAAAITRAVAAETKNNHQKPFYAAWMGINSAREGRAILEENKIPWYPFPERAVAAFMHLAQYRRHLDLLYETPPDLPIEFPDIDHKMAQEVVELVYRERRTNLTEAEGKKLLQCYGIPVWQADENVPEQAYRLAVSTWKDAVWGPVIAFGAGGQDTETPPEQVIGLPPLNLALSKHLVAGAAIARILQGNQHRPAAPVDWLYNILCRFAYLVMDFPEINAMRMDPFVLNEKQGGATKVVVDLVPQRPEQRERYAHLSIQPYPTQWIKKIQLRDGTAVTLRPIRPEDEPLEAALVKNTSRESLYFRFFGFVPGMDHRMLARFTHIDYDREMAIVAQVEEEGGHAQLIGVVRIVGDGWRDTAEYAILVQDQWQGRGIGSILTAYILEIACVQGYRQITATFLKTNGNIRRLFERFRFEIKGGSDESDYAELTCSAYTAPLPQT